MNYVHIPTGKVAKPCPSLPEFYVVEGSVLPGWLFKNSNDWEVDHEVGTRVWDKQTEHIYTKDVDGKWKLRYLTYEDLLIRKDIRSGLLKLLKPHEKVWTTLEGRQIPFTEVTQQHWSNIFHYHMNFGQSIQCEIALSQLRNKGWELLSQNRF